MQKKSPNLWFPRKKWPTVKERSQSPHIDTSTVLQIPVATYRASCSKSFIEVISANTAAKAPPWNVGTGNRKAPCSSRTDRIFFLPTIRFGSVTCTEESKIKRICWELLLTSPMYRGHKGKTRFFCCTCLLPKQRGSLSAAKSGGPWGASIPESLQPWDQEVIFGQIRMGCQA